MSHLQISSPEFPSDAISENFSKCFLANDWVYVASDGEDFATIEGNCGPCLTRRECLEDRVHSASHERLKDGETGLCEKPIESVIVDRNCTIDQAKAQIVGLRRTLRFLGLDSSALSEIEAALNGIETRPTLDVDGNPTQLVHSDGVFSTADLPLYSELGVHVEHSDTSSIAPSVLEDYFDKACEIFVAKEQLTELDYEQHFQIAPAQSEAQQHDDLHSIGANADSEYNSRRERLIEAIAVSEAELHDLRQACILQGIEPQLHRFRRVSQQSVDKRKTVTEYCQALAAPFYGACDALVFH